MTTNELHELAKDPFAFDSRLAALHTDLATVTSKRDQAMSRMHSGAGDRRVYVTVNRQAWGKSHAEVIQIARQMADEDVRGRHNIDMGAELTLWTTAEDAIGVILTAINEMDAVYAEYRWTRFFPSVTKSQPHIHRSLTCHTLYPTTVMRWEPALSGHTDEQAVAKLDEALCSVCFPDAPVALHEYQSKRSQAERDQRAAEKLARDAAKAAKQLTEAEQFRTEYRRDQVTTVAACKEVIRHSIETEVALEGYSTSEYAARWTGDSDSLARLIGNVKRDLEAQRRDAQRATAVLIDRETMHPGWGMNATEISKMQTNKYRAARKEWAQQ